MSFSNVSVEYVPEEKGIVRRMHYASFPSMFRSNLYEALAVGNAPRQCPICQKFFLTTNARRQKYCTGYAPEEYGGMTCVQVGNRMGREHREQTILKARNAICSNCGGMMPMEKRFRFQEISIKIMNGVSDKGAEIAYHAALDRLAVQLIEDGTCRIVDLVLKNLEQTENKKAAATYLYQVDCDGEWGEIRFDFENKRIKIEKLAEWDTTRSHKYAWMVIDFITYKGTKVLPERKRIILWDKNIGRKKKTVQLQDGKVIYLPFSR